MLKKSLDPHVIVGPFHGFMDSRQGQEKPVNPGDIYDAAIALFYKEKYEEAIATFSKIILSFPKSNLVSYSRYMIGQCYLKMEKYDEAIQQFELYLKTYPDGDRVKGAASGIQTSKEKLKEKEKQKSLHLLREEGESGNVSAAQVTVNVRPRSLFEGSLLKRTGSRGESVPRSSISRERPWTRWKRG